MGPTSIERWRKKREGGKARYILLTGVLGWGMTMFVVVTFVVNKRPEGFKSILVGLLIWVVCGAGFGWLTWALNEHLYRKATANGVPN
jgi:hypothetical protein